LSCRARALLLLANGRRSRSCPAGCAAPPAKCYSGPAGSPPAAQMLQTVGFRGSRSIVAALARRGCLLHESWECLLCALDPRPLSKQRQGDVVSNFLV